jgi:hypothetical protein
LISESSSVETEKKGMDSGLILDNVLSLSQSELIWTGRDYRPTKECPNSFRRGRTSTRQRVFQKKGQKRKILKQVYRSGILQTLCQLRKQRRRSNKH